MIDRLGNRASARAAVAGLAALLALSAAAAPRAASASDAPALVPHEARYDLSLLSLQSANRGSAGGLFLVRLERACEEWRLDTDLQVSIETEDQGETTIASRSRYEETIADAGRSGTLTFRQRQEVNGFPVSEVRGEAKRTAEGGRVRFERPAAREVALPTGVQFPISGAQASLAALFSGQALVSQRLFDGGEEGALIAVDLAAGAPEPPPETVAGDAALLRGRMLRVVTAFYAVDAPDSEPLSTYIADILENGVTTRLTIDVGLASVEAELSAVRRLPRPDC
ncbi:MAG: cell envelope integrity EipB family protein [Alphaproteobacteria bacterium]|nr:cell envelope integrity EipB family protein [Alphaproteobacteria bacterium]